MLFDKHVERWMLKDNRYACNIKHGCTLSKSFCKTKIIYIMKAKGASFYILSKTILKLP